MSDYSIKANKLSGPKVAHVETKKKGGKMTPKFLCIHYTAGDNYEGDVRTLSEPGRAASCHLVLAPDGRLTQVGDFRDTLWHAGKSAWKGYSGLNSHSIGIEVTCPGPLEGDKMWTGKKIVEGKPWPFVFARHKNGRGKEQNWALFTEAQVAVVIEVGTLLMAHYKLLEAVGHDDISPFRKIDPGPSCPPEVFAILNGTKDDGEAVELPEIVASGRLKVQGVAPDTLSLRSSPNGEKRGDLAEGQIVERLSVDGNWTQVRTPAGYVGWAYSAYLKPYAEK